MLLLLLSILACVVVPQSPAGDDTNKHSGSFDEASPTVDADAE